MGSRQETEEATVLTTAGCAIVLVAETVTSNQPERIKDITPTKSRSPSQALNQKLPTQKSHATGDATIKKRYHLRQKNGVTSPIIRTKDEFNGLRGFQSTPEDDPYVLILLENDLDETMSTVQNEAENYAQVSSLDQNTGANEIHHINGDANHNEFVSDVAVDLVSVHEKNQDDTKNENFGITTLSKEFRVDKDFASSKMRPESRDTCMSVENVDSQETYLNDQNTYYNFMADGALPISSDSGCAFTNNESNFEFKSIALGNEDATETSTIPLSHETHSQDGSQPYSCRDASDICFAEEIQDEYAENTAGCDGQDTRQHNMPGMTEENKLNLAESWHSDINVRSYANQNENISEAVDEEDVNKEAELVIAGFDHDTDIIGNCSTCHFPVVEDSIPESGRHTAGLNAEHDVSSEFSPISTLGKPAIVKNEHESQEPLLPTEKSLSAPNCDALPVRILFSYPAEGNNRVTVTTLEEKMLSSEQMLNDIIIRWRIAKDPFTKDFIFIPINKNYHWSLVIINKLMCTNPKEPLAFYLDSVGADPVPVELVIKEYIKELLVHSEGMEGSIIAERPFRTIAVPLQTNGYDCGLFVLHYIDKFLEDPDKFLLQVETHGEYSSWFDPSEATRKREEIRCIVHNICKSSQAPNPTDD